MTLLSTLTNLIADPPPSHAFEISEAGIAWSQSGQTGFREFEDGVLDVSPGRDNIAKPVLFNDHVAAIAPRTGKRRPAALILPDFAARVQVLDFDNFPSDDEERKSLIKFRVRKTVPFDVDSAVVSYYVQPIGNKYDVVSAIMALEIVAKYEAPFRAAGYHPGLVTTSSLAALNLAPASGLALVVKVSGRTLVAMAQENNRLRLARTVDLDEVSTEEVLNVLHPTIAYIEDQLNSQPEKLYLIGNTALAQPLARELNLPVEPLYNDEYSAGLQGYLKGGN